MVIHIMWIQETWKLTDTYVLISLQSWRKIDPYAVDDNKTDLW